MKKVSIYLCVAAALMISFVPLASADIIDVFITGNWTADDFTVTGPSDPHYDINNPVYDGQVFGVSPAAGSTTIQLQVNTDSAISFSAGYITTGGDTLAHDWYGYSDVTLVDPPFTFGTATWNESGILDDLIGPDGEGVTIWADTDITVGAPSRLSFRMFGTASGLTSDIFVGSRSTTTIGPQFLLWEYYMGEEIRSDNYSVRVAPIPVPAAIWLLGSGMVAMAAWRRKKR